MQNLLNKIKGRLTKKKINNFEIYIEHSKGVTLEVEKNQLDTLEYEEGLGFSLRIILDKRLGFSYGTDFSITSVDYVIDQALRSAALSPIQAGIQWVKPTSFYPKVDNFDQTFETHSLQQKIELACQAEDMARQSDKRIKRIKYNSFSDRKEEVLLFHSKGLQLESQKTNAQQSLMAIAEQGDESEMACQTSASSHWEDLNPQNLGRQAAFEAAHRLGGKRISNYKGPILLNPETAADMLEILAPSTLAENIHKKKSFLIGKKGQKIYSSEVTLIDNGLYPRAIETKSFDAEGTPRQLTTIIERGVVKDYLYDFYWACRDGVSSTGNSTRENIKTKPTLAVTNFYLKPGRKKSEILLKDMDKGVVVTEAIGMHTADEISGDFSVGIQGYFVEKGKVSFPIRSVVLSGNLHDLFSKVRNVGSDLRFFGNIGSPSLLIEEASISGE